MKIIFHIGMGKTGTSSIQKALHQNSGKLAEQKTAYLGMWFDSIDPAYLGYEGDKKFFSEPPKKKVELASRFIDCLSERSQKQGTKVFIVSNENIFANVSNMVPFLDALQKLAPVSLIAFLRNPYSWLPSAYSQWGIRHKTNLGPIPPYAARARELIGQYEGIRRWVDKYREILSVRSFEKGKDVVLDFAQTAQLELDTSKKHYLQRPEPTEIVLRALFNNRFGQPVLPDSFDNMVINTNHRPIVSSQEMVDRCFNYDETPKIIEEKRELFEFIRDQFGLNYLTSGEPSPTLPDTTDIRDRMIDFLTEITLDQAQRLRTLERLVTELRDQK